MMQSGSFSHLSAHDLNPINHRNNRASLKKQTQNADPSQGNSSSLLFSPTFKCVTSLQFYAALLLELQKVASIVDSLAESSRQFVWSNLFEIAGLPDHKCSEHFTPILSGWLSSPTVNLLAVELLYVAFNVATLRFPALLSGHSFHPRAFDPPKPVITKIPQSKVIRPVPVRHPKNIGLANGSSQVTVTSEQQSRTFASYPLGDKEQLPSLAATASFVSRSPVTRASSASKFNEFINAPVNTIHASPIPHSNTLPPLSPAQPIDTAEQQTDLPASRAEVYTRALSQFTVVSTMKLHFWLTHAVERMGYSARFSTPKSKNGLVAYVQIRSSIFKL